VLGYGPTSPSTLEGGGIVGQSGPVNPSGVGQVDNEHRVTLEIANADRGRNLGVFQKHVLSANVSRPDHDCIH
jgi:hypothetical protein